MQIQTTMNSGTKASLNIAPVETPAVVEHVEVRVPQVPAREVAREEDVAVAEISPEPVRAPRLAEIRGETASQPRPPEPSGELMVSEAPQTVEVVAAPPEESLETEAMADMGGVILVVGDPQPVLLSSSCHIEIRFPDGSKSIRDESIERDAVGRPRSVHVVCQELAPENGALEQGG